MQKKSRGLGKGLDILLKSDEPTKTQGIVTLKVDDIEPSENQPRKNFDAEALGELAASIDKHGLLQPILVRETSLGKYEIIAGERRWRAVKELGKTEIQAIVKDVEEQHQAEMALIENLQREDLNVLEEAAAYKKLADEWSYTQEKIARAIGKSRPYVANTMRLLQLPSEIREWLAEGALTAGHARTLLTIKDEKKQLAMAKEIITAQLTVREAEAKSKPKGKVTAPPPDIKDMQERIGAYFGSRVRLKTNQKGGRIEIFFENREDFSRILNILGID